VPERSPAYAHVEERDVMFFRALLGDAGVITDHDDLVPYNTDWMKIYQGQSKLALRPKTTEQVAQIMRYCNERGLAVVPQGGNTGLVGGSVPLFDEIVLSLSGMDKVISFDDRSGVVICEAGCILQNLESFVNEKGFMVPLDLGAKGTCQIGGNVATNAGGLRLVRYGSLKGSVLGLEAVLADGTVLDSLNTLRKDNTGYDVKQLLIGSEGSLAIITKVALATPRKPQSMQVVVLACSSFQRVLDAVSLAQRTLSEIVSAIEFFDQECLSLLVCRWVM
jgi:FAD/FMN-containing dehydrogenase